jgi:hypothetical protein
VIADRLIEAAEAARLSLEPEGDRLIVEAEGEPPPDLITALREHKAEVIETLRWLRRPLVMRDGRRLYRFRADAIPDDVPDCTKPLIEAARRSHAVLVADGSELIVVERPRPGLPVEVLRSLRMDAGAIIAALRQECRLPDAVRHRVRHMGEAEFTEAAG